MSPQTILALALVLPALTGLVVGRMGRWPNLREATSLVAGGVVFGLVTHLLPMVQDGARPTLELLPVLEGVPLSFTLEPLGMLFAMVASGLWIVTTMYAIGYMRGHHETHQSRFYAFFAVAISAAMGVALAGNLLTLFIFYEVLTLSTYPLVTHHQTDKARRAGRIYLGILLTTSICFLLLAILWTWDLTGTLEFTRGGILEGHIEGWHLGLLLGLYAFGIGKAALMPFHRWLPNAMVAPTPVSALLHAVAVVKAGVFSILKVVVYVFGIDFLSASGMNVWLMYVASFTLLAASIGALYKDNLKARLAYSTISQLSYIVLGAAFATASGVLGGGMHIAMHAFGKITLFFCAGAIMVAAHKTEVSQLDGIGRRMPLTMTAFFIASLSIIGLPPTGGSWSKWFLALGAIEADQLIFVGVLMASSLLSIGYLMPIVARAFFVAPPEGMLSEEAQGHFVGTDAGSSDHGESGGHAASHAAPGNHPLGKTDTSALEGAHDTVSVGDPAGPSSWSGFGPWKGKWQEAPLMSLVPIWITATGCVILFFLAQDLYGLLLPLVTP